MTVNERLEKIKKANEIAAEIYFSYIKPDRIDTFKINYFDTTESYFVVTFETDYEDDSDTFYESLDSMEELVEKLKGIFKGIEQATVSNWYGSSMEIEFTIRYETDE